MSNKTFSEDTESKPEIDEIELTYDRNFDLLLIDSIDLLLYAGKVSPIDDFRSTLARSSTLSSILLLECAASICIKGLQFEKSIYNDIDRLPTIAKFDVYLRTKFKNKKLDRGLNMLKEYRNLRS